MEKLLYIIKKNNYGNPQLSEAFIEGATPINFYDLKPDDYWAIKDPSESIKTLLSEIHPKYSIYTCSGGTFAISPKAAEFYKPENTGQGSGTIVEFIDPYDNKWYLLVSDEKAYIANVQGVSEDKETYEECIKREVKEETNIDLSTITPIEIASYSFIYRNALVDCEYRVVSKMFYVYLQWDKVKHLFPTGLIPDEVNIFDVTSLPFALDEVKYIIAIPTDKVNDVPEHFDQIKVSKIIKGVLTQVSAEYVKTSHHRQFIDLFRSNNPIVKPVYLDTITFDVRYGEAYSKFCEVNK